jgi:hypothetical protein
LRCRLRRIPVDGNRTHHQAVVEDGNRAGVQNGLAAVRFPHQVIELSSVSHYRSVARMVSRSGPGRWYVARMPATDSYV